MEAKMAAKKTTNLLGAAFMAGAIATFAHTTSLTYDSKGNTTGFVTRPIRPAEDAPYFFGFGAVGMALAAAANAFRNRGPK
jgi:hypothetical protein